MLHGNDIYFIFKFFLIKVPYIFKRLFLFSRDEILNHPALWSFIERRAKISRIAHNLNILVHDLVGNYSWISMVDKNSELKEILQGSFDLNYSNTVNNLVRLFRNKLMHEDDDSMKQVETKLLARLLVEEKRMFVPAELDHVLMFVS
ncbi:hypothetical protein AXF42_Ash021232 [Apostasia shenzhenica]|uniref:Uncharacterized protein n=1 Tax=Apostasia shenzhenica TaxID=1088818 RepID=A0A2I0BCS2_9ASPA|nr:hypothetical protein AXF42_Ash021232 [Apostasia shenzhenica]